LVCISALAATEEDSVRRYLDKLGEPTAVYWKSTVLRPKALGEAA
jgi:hypothetical protein